MTYAYLEKLNKTSLLEKTSSSLSFYGEIDKNTKRMGTDPYMSIAERIQFYEQLKALSKSGELPEKYNKSLEILDKAFSQMEVTMSSATKEGELVYLYDSNGHRVSMKQLLDNPNATYKWQCEGGDLNTTSYLTKDTKISYGENPNGAPRQHSETTVTTANGVSQDSSGCIDKTYTFEAAGSTILGDIKTGKGNSALFMVGYSPHLFR